MPRLREETQTARVRHLLAAAESCFARRGFDATTVADICEEAGVSVGAFYSHFDGKEAVVETICRPAMASKRELLDGLAVSGATLLEAPALEELIERLLSTPEGGSDAALDVHLWSESLRNSRLRDLTSRAFRELDRGLARVVRNGQAAGELREDLPSSAVAALLVAAVAGLEVRRALGIDDDAGPILRVLRALAGEQ